MTAHSEHVGPPVVGDPHVDVKQLVADIEAIDNVLQAQATWAPDDSRVGITVVLGRFDWGTRNTVIEMIDTLHRKHVDALAVDFDVVDRDHRSFTEFV